MDFFYKGNGRAALAAAGLAMVLAGNAGAANGAQYSDDSLTAFTSNNLYTAGSEISGMLSMSAATSPQRSFWSALLSTLPASSAQDVAYIARLTEGKPGTYNCGNFGTVTLEITDPDGDGVNRSGDSYRLTYQGCFTASTTPPYPSDLKDGVFTLNVVEDLIDNDKQRSGKFYVIDRLMHSTQDGTHYSAVEGQVEYAFVRDAKGWVSGKSHQELSSFGSHDLDSSGHEIARSSSPFLTIDYTINRTGRNRYEVRQTESWQGRREWASGSSYRSIDDGNVALSGVAESIALTGAPGPLDLTTYRELSVDQRGSAGLVRLAGAGVSYAALDESTSYYLEGRYGKWAATSTGRGGRDAWPNVLRDSFTADNAMNVLYKGGYVDGGGYFDLKVDVEQRDDQNRPRSFAISGRLNSPAGISTVISTQQPLVWGRYGQPVGGMVNFQGSQNSSGRLRVTDDGRIAIAARLSDGSRAANEQGWNNLPWIYFR
ncbi:hypothetical protein SAMN02745857_04067 [Andreprevotia lacus DSM 23236]|jgi:hypothetical protein|uniref:Uncharacterized protein n=1 Tax=Andreprevotia lacus DSM 23236 TaxID=1121001 RepID=A0A1W1Y0I9_9NEIS|nr:hypothetical protein [Andreprevotia lacus]SMC29729.1 hypothetical protein SAMN02745857_04067 [Andreprevotia lacus DSM 23236]